jgi:hypothetical protein
MRGDQFIRQWRITRAIEANRIFAFPLDLSFPYSFDKENKHKRIHPNVGTLARDIFTQRHKGLHQYWC